MNLPLLFLFTALPWTSFWGNKVLVPVQQAVGQQGPRAAGFAPVFAGGAATEAGSLQQMLEQARARGMAGDLMFYMVDGPPGSAVSLRSVAAKASDERYLLLDRADAKVIDDAGWSSFPLMAKTVATGVKLHEADYFGRSGRWVNTAFALALAWLCVTGTMAWWRRKPARALGVPPSSQRPWPWWLRVLALVGFLVLPLLALSAACLWLLETAWARLAPTGRPA